MNGIRTRANVRLIRLIRLLTQILGMQARDALSQISLESVREDRLPELSHWVKITVEAVRPMLLEAYQESMAESASRIGARLASRMVGGGEESVSIAELPSQSPSALPFSRFHRVLPTSSVFGQGKALKTFALRRKSGPAVVVKSGSIQLVVTNLWNPKVLDAVDQLTFNFCSETLDTATVDLKQAFAELRKLLKAGVKEGEALRALSAKVMRIFGDPYRAARIAVTELSRVSNAGQLMAAEESGVVTQKTWVAGPSACDRCLDLDGVTVDLEKPFYVDPNGGPYAVVNHPPLHPHCYCIMQEEL